MEENKKVIEKEKTPGSCLLQSIGLGPAVGGLILANNVGNVQHHIKNKNILKTKCFKQNSTQIKIKINFNVTSINKT